MFFFIGKQTERIQLNYILANIQMVCSTQIPFRAFEKIKHVFKINFKNCFNRQSFICICNEITQI